MFTLRSKTVRTQLVSLKQTAYREIPLSAALAGLSFRACERLGEWVTDSRKGRLSLLSLVAMMLFSGPAAAQAGCGSGPLQFLGSIHQLVTQSAGTIIITMVIAAGVLKMLPMRGTNSWGNALIGSVIVGVVFLVLGPAFVDLADQSSSAVNMNAQCTGGGGGA